MNAVAVIALLGTGLVQVQIDDLDEIIAAFCFMGVGIN